VFPNPNTHHKALNPKAPLSSLFVDVVSHQITSQEALNTRAIISTLSFLFLFLVLEPKPLSQKAPTFVFMFPNDIIYWY